MQSSVAVAHDLVTRIQPFDETERAHRAAAICWLESTDDVFRRVRPATPPKHLVSYCVVADPGDLSIFLVDHVNAGLWLPPGGHVEPDDHPLETARRELAEELNLDADFSVIGTQPLFVTVTETVGADHGHVDVSLWYAAAADRRTPMTPDPREFNGACWWTADEIASAPGEPFDPHFHRFMAKLISWRAEPRAAEHHRASGS
ncbi:MAG TPA: NUDIX domain-containing protein [Dermatophilaceae bacterium]|jgi:8-oxo-dGTP diphosphatase